MGFFKFKYPVVVADNYRYMGGVENTNTFKHDGDNNYQIVLESAWVTIWCPIRLLAFFMAYTEVNAYMAMKYFLKNDETLWILEKRH